MYFITVLLIAFVLALSNAQPPNYLPTSFADSDCICTAEYNPQCGVDGRTYSNPCLATRCAGVAIAYPGRCEDCPCTLEWNPQCGVDGKTYGNPCALRCANVQLAYPGRCNDCICPRIYDPVCGVDGRTYANNCLRRCRRVRLAYYGECRGSGGDCPNEFCFFPPCRYARCPRFRGASCRKGCGCRPRFYVWGIDVTDFCGRRGRTI